MVEALSIIDSSHPHFRDLVKQAYNEVFLAVFPEEEMDAYDKVINILSDKVPGMGAVVTLIGDKLNDPKKRLLYGASLAYYYIDDQIGFLVYNAKRPGCEIQNIGKDMVAARAKALHKIAAKNGDKLEAIIFEVHNPQKMTDDEKENDVMPPEKRISNFKKIGAEEFPFDFEYVQPPVEDGMPHCHNLMLMYYPVNGRHAGPKHVRGFLKGIYNEASEGKPITDKHYWRSMDLISQWEKAAQPQPAATPAQRVPAKPKTPKPS